MERTPKEQAYFHRIRQRIVMLTDYLCDNSVPVDDDAELWFEFVARIRDIQGNISNDQSFLATMLAKEYLSQRFDIGDFDAAAKAQGAPGVDIDLITCDGKRIVGEIKTTVPYGNDDLGAQQRTTFKKDFDKLTAADADYKFFFVTNERTFDIVNARYLSEIPGVEVILLPQVIG